MINSHYNQQLKARNYSRILKYKATKAENFLYKKLKEKNIKFQFQKYFYTNDRCFIADFSSNI